MGPPPPPPLGSRQVTPDRAQTVASRPPSIYDPAKPIEQLPTDATTKPSATVPTGPPALGNIGDIGNVGPVGDPNGVRDGIGPIGTPGVPQGNVGEPTPPPTPKPAEKPQPPAEKQLVRLTSVVLTGNAIEPKTPDYPVKTTEVSQIGRA